MNAIKIVSAFLIFSMLLGCNKDDTSIMDDPDYSNEKSITSFQFLSSDNPFNVIADIDQTNNVKCARWSRSNSFTTGS